MATVIKTTFKLRRGLLSVWQEKNPILAEGEPGWAMDAEILKIGDGVRTWNELNAVTGVDPSMIEVAVEKYMEEHPINIKTDETLSVSGQPADAAAVREQCLFNTDQIIFYAGDADDNTFE